METIGKIENGVIEKEFYNQGFIYKNFDAFKNKSTEICYVPEYSEEDLENANIYNYFDLLKLIQDFINENEEVKVWVEENDYTSEMIVENLFETLDWQSPETIIDEWIIGGTYTY